jgi:hypothetical protein
MKRLRHRILLLVTAAVMATAMVAGPTASAALADSGGSPNKNPHGKWTGQKNAAKCGGQATHPHCSN